MSVRRSLILLFLIILLIPIALFRARLSASSEGDSFTDIEFYRVQRGDVELTISAIGTVEADQIVQLSFVVPGRVNRVLVKQGDYVVSGDMLVQLDDSLQRTNYEQSQLNLERAQLDMEELTAPPRDEDIRIADANIDAAWGAYLSIERAVTPEDIQAAELNYEQAVVIYEDLKAQRDQAPGGYGGTAYTTLDAQTGSASFNMEIARLQLESLQNGSSAQLNVAYARVVAAQREKDRLFAGPTEFQVRSGEVSIQQAEAQLNRAKVAYDRMTLVAPFDGVVSSVQIEEGSLVAPGLVVVELTDVTPLRLTVQVDEIDVGFIRENIPARIELDALPEVDLPATLERISAVGQNIGGIVTYDVSVRLDGDDPRVRVGMTAEATVVVDSRKDVLIVPNLYVRLDRRTGQGFVNVLGDDNTIAEIEIQLGLRGPETSEVIAGLSESQLIALDLSGSGFESFLED